MTVPHVSRVYSFEDPDLVKEAIDKVSQARPARTAEIWTPRDVGIFSSVAFARFPLFFST